MAIETLEAPIEKVQSEKVKEADISSLNQVVCDKINTALRDRREYENKLAAAHAQRFCLDRPERNNSPFPNASNFRYPLSDTLIDQKKPFLFKVSFASDNIAYFKSMDPLSTVFNNKTAAFFDFIVKEQTDFQEDIQYALDAHLQDGEDYVKITWNEEKQVPEAETIESMFIISPARGKKFKDVPWFAEVLHLSKKECKEAYPEVKGIDEIFESLESGNSYDSRVDQSNKEEAEYRREGINFSGKKGYLVLYSYHYTTKDSRRIRTISPDRPDIDFLDDREYPYDYCIKNKTWMVEHGKREYINAKTHSSRGYPEVVREGEYLMSGLVRSQHNALTMYGNPMLTAPNGVTGSTQNITWEPGSFLPFQVEAVNIAPPPFTWDAELSNQRSIWERRAATVDFGIGSGNEKNDSRTKYEVQQITNFTMAGLDMESGNWKRHLGLIFKQMWGLICQFKPKNLMYYLGDEIEKLPPEAINENYLITPTGSIDAINKEEMGRKAIAFWQMMQNNQYANQEEGWKNVVEWSYPGQVQRFYINPAQRQQQQSKKTLSDVSVIVATGAQMTPDQNDDFYTAALTATQFLQNADQQGRQYPSDTAQKVGNYIAIAREALKKQNKQQYEQLTQQLDLIDQQNHMRQQQQQLAAVAGSMQQSLGNNSLPQPLIRKIG